MKDAMNGWLKLFAPCLGILMLSWPDAEARQSAEPRVIDIVARRFAFEPAMVEVKDGERVRLRITSADGLHGFQIKAFKISKEIPRGGEVVVIDFVPKGAGEYPILCSEYCGDGHGDMKGMLVVSARESGAQ